MRGEPVTLGVGGGKLVGQPGCQPLVRLGGQVACEVVALDPRDLRGLLARLARGARSLRVDLGQAGGEVTRDVIARGVNVKERTLEEVQTAAVDRVALVRRHRARCLAAKLDVRAAHVPLAVRAWQHRLEAHAAPKEPVREQVAVRLAATRDGAYLRPIPASACAASHVA